MLGKLSGILKKHANPWLVGLFFAGTLIFNGYIFPAQQAQLAAASGGVRPIDVQFFYTPEQVYSMVAAYGDAGRAGYRTFELTGDIVYPIVYTLFFALLLTWLFQRGFSSDSPMQKLNVVPLGGWLFDLFENLGIASMLTVYPSTPALLAWLTAAFTLCKWLFAGAAFLLILLGLFMALKNKSKKQGLPVSAGK